MVYRILALMLFLASFSLSAIENQDELSIAQRAQVLSEAQNGPLYKPFIERYILDELKNLRKDLAEQRVEILQQIYDREHQSTDRAVAYATDTVTYFFYLIAAASSILVLVGWTSIRDIKERVHSLANQKIDTLVSEYEARLFDIEKQLNQKSLSIDENREEIELTQEIQSLWLRAGQDINPHNKISIYDQILKLRPDDCEAITYKADSALELNEPQWAANLCRQALALDPDNAHAFYQLACAHTALNQFDDAVRNLQEAIMRSESYRDELSHDTALKPLGDYTPFLQLMNGSSEMIHRVKHAERPVAATVES